MSATHQAVMCHLLQVVGLLLGLVDIIQSGEDDCMFPQFYCPDKGCVDMIYGCNGCLLHQTKCPDGKCVYPYEDCEGPGPSVSCNPGYKKCRDDTCVHVSETCEDCPSSMKKCDDGRCVLFMSSCTSKCKIYETECDDGRCALFCDSSTSYSSKCGLYKAECPDGRCMSSMSECRTPDYKAVDHMKAKGFYVAIPLFMISVMFSLLCRHCKRDAQNTRLASLTAARASAFANMTQSQRMFRPYSGNRPANRYTTPTMQPIFLNNTVHDSAINNDTTSTSERLINDQRLNNEYDPPAYHSLSSLSNNDTPTTTIIIQAPSYNTAVSSASAAAAAAAMHREPQLRHAVVHIPRPGESGISRNGEENDTGLQQSRHTVSYIPRHQGLSNIREEEEDRGARNCTSQDRLLAHSYPQDVNRSRGGDRDDPPPPYPGPGYFASPPCTADLPPPPAYDDIVK